MSALERRVAVLESRKCNTYVSPPPIPLSMYLVALFAGRWQPHESPATAYHRALGCENVADYHKLTAEDRHERHRNAMRKIFRRRGVDLDTASPGEIDAVLMKLVKKLAKSGMPVPDSSWVPVAA